MINMKIIIILKNAYHMTKFKKKSRTYGQKHIKCRKMIRVSLYVYTIQQKWEIQLLLKNNVFELIHAADRKATISLGHFGRVEM